MDLSILIPEKNQAKKMFDHLLNGGIEYFDSLSISYEIVIINDASDEEDTKFIEEHMAELPSKVRYLPYLPDKGKWKAIKRGYKEAKGDHILFMDADFATDIHILEKMIPDWDKYDCLFASRYMKGSYRPVKQPLIRRITSWGARTINKMKFHLKGVKDTQCGFKIVKKDVALAFEKKSIIDKFAGDVELLYYLKLNGYSFKEYPAIWTDDPDSSVGNPSKAAKEFYKDLRRIKKNKVNYIEGGESHAD